MWKGAPAEIFKRAEQLRKNPAEAEQLLWIELQSDVFKKYHFRRQHPIHLFIADFYSQKLKLIIEVDGEYHDCEEQQLKDRARIDLLEYQGSKLIRFTNQQIIQDIVKVRKILSDEINS